MGTQRPFKEPYAETLCDVIHDRAVLKFNPIDRVPDLICRLRVIGEKVAGVVDVHGNLVGMLTEKGIIRRILSRFDNPPPNIEDLYDHKCVSYMTAWDVMIENPDTLHIDDTVEDALDMMTYLSHSYMPVVDSQEKLLGIVGIEELRCNLEKKNGVLKSLDDPISLYAIQQKLYDLNLGTSHAY